MKQGSEHVREVGSSRQGKRFDERELSIGEMLFKRRRELVTKRVLIVIVILLLLTILLVLVFGGFFGRMLDALTDFIE